MGPHEYQASNLNGVSVEQSPDSMTHQTTLLRSISCVGVGLHSGAKVTLTLNPAPADSGIRVRRTDLPGAPEILARWDHVVDTTLCTTLGNADGVTVGTVEHLMAALSGCHIDNTVIEVDGPEVPIMDGSSQPFVFLMECAGTKNLSAPRRVIEILRAVRVGSETEFAELAPYDSFSVGFEIEFAHTAVARQALEVSMINGTFKKEIARARTFGFMDEVEKLRASGLALGGSLDNAVVVDGDEVLNEGGLRYDDEFVRHKVLDAVGDLYLAGGLLQARYRGHRSGHSLNNRLLRQLFICPDAWRIVDYSEANALTTAGSSFPSLAGLAATA